MTHAESLVHDYEELPSERNVPAGSPKYDYADERGQYLTLSPSLGNVNTAASMNTLAGSDVPALYTQRRRENPLYDACNGRDHLVKDSTEKGTGSFHCCIIVLAVACFLCIGFAVVIILMLTGLVSPMKVETTEHPATAALRSSHNSTEYELQKALLRIEELELQYQTLSIQLQQMQSTLTNQTSALELNLSSQNHKFEQHKLELSNMFIVINSNIAAVNSSMFKELETISKMEGPRGPVGYNGSQGPPGAGDLSKCKFLNITTGSRSDPISGTWVPNAAQVTDITNWVVLGTECSSNGRSTHQLESRKSKGYTQYRCICSTTIKQESSCDITVWLCPVTS